LKTIEVVVFDDAETEDEERILLNLPWPSGAKTSTSQSIVTIVDETDKTSHKAEELPSE
jgi:hypothetical protein